MAKIGGILVAVFIVMGMVFASTAVSALDFHTPEVQVGYNPIVFDEPERNYIPEVLFTVLWMCILCGLYFLPFFVFVVWLLSLIDIIQRDDWDNANDKLFWFLLIFVISIASLYYYFFYRKQLDSKSNNFPITN